MFQRARNVPLGLDFTDLIFLPAALIVTQRLSAGRTLPVIFTVLPAPTWRLTSTLTFVSVFACATPVAAMIIIPAASIVCDCGAHRYTCLSLRLRG